MIEIVPEEHPAKPLTVGHVAELVGVSVRTLHHWDQIGLVTPSGRNWAGYRLYDADDVARIYRVLVHRDLGLPLADIRRILDDPSVDAREHLTRQRDQVADRIDHLRSTLRAVTTMIERIDMTSDNSRTTNVTISPEEQARIFGTDWDPAWQDEARERWGDSPQWAESVRRTRDWGATEWQQVKADVDALDADCATALRNGVEPGSPEANALAERHRESVAVHYDCTHAMHVLLGRMYTEDPRFAEHYDSRMPGLAAWLRTAIEENARAHGVDPETARWE
ncbi:MAG: MerR family transcriptional regulator [Brachybacterium sp.]|nr:MerR family transcriptional regulator [Brachybacterium sp.]